jgi:predicted nuclease with TOPRIM domain
MDAGQENSARWLEEGRELIDRLREAIGHLVQENEGLLRRFNELQAVMARMNQDNNRLRAERDELLAAFNRLAHLVEQVRLSRGGGAVR